MAQQIEMVGITEVEKDDRANTVKSEFAERLKKQQGFVELSDDVRGRASHVLESLQTIRFESRSDLKQVATALLVSIAPDISDYIELTLNKAVSAIQEDRGVLVIYTGGTIGSAPKDPSDPDSPQIVRPWRELKAALPNLESLGYPVDAVSFEEPLDSCNVGPSHWYTICEIIRKNYADYEGFVILHGTDTMVYTSSALAFMLDGLTKPVVLTGSQVAGIVNARNDAHQNIITAIQLANARIHGLPVIPEVIVAFGNLFSRGCRAKKMNVVDYQGFFPPNFPVHGKAGEFITIDRKQIRKSSSAQLNIRSKLETNVTLVEVFPGMQDASILQNILSDQNLRGVVLKSYGAGNIPTDPSFLGLFRKFIEENDGVVVNVTSVPEGEVSMGLYETSQILLDIGIIGGFDITPEAAMTKLQVLLGEFGDDVETVKDLMQQSIAGEQRLSLKATRFDGGGSLNALDRNCVLASVPLQSVADPERIEKVMLRLVDAELVPGKNEKVDISVLLDIDGDITPLRVFSRGQVPERALSQDDTLSESLAFDLTSEKASFTEVLGAGPLSKGRTIQLQLQIEPIEGASIKWDKAELNIYVSEE